MLLGLLQGDEEEVCTRWLVEDVFLRGFDMAFPTVERPKATRTSSRLYRQWVESGMEWLHLKIGSSGYREVGRLGLQDGEHLEDLQTNRLRSARSGQVESARFGDPDVPQTEKCRALRIRPAGQGGARTSGEPDGRE